MQSSVRPPDSGDTWIVLTEDELPVGQAHDWCVDPSCGAVVVFSGIVRDHAEGRSGVTHLAYEAYSEQVIPRLEAVAAEMRRQWPSVVRVVMWHRTGRLDVGETSVVVAVSSPHRQEAFEAARFGIDTVKTSAPIWKRESWEEGDDWGTGAHPISPVAGR